MKKQTLFVLSDEDQEIIKFLKKLFNEKTDAETIKVAMRKYYYIITQS